VFRESLIEEIASAPSFEAARATLGERAELLAIQSLEEWAAERKAQSMSWLRDE
jgi:hypothetical protein